MVIRGLGFVCIVVIVNYVCFGVDWILRLFRRIEEDVVNVRF